MEKDVSRLQDEVRPLMEMPMQVATILADLRHLMGSVDALRIELGKAEKSAAKARDDAEDRQTGIINRYIWPILMVIITAALTYLWGAS